jgi:hypothetical protein
MTRRESPCHAKIVILVASTQTNAAVRLSRDPGFESVAKDGKPIEDAAHETVTIGPSGCVPWFAIGESTALTPELTQTAVRRVRGE